MMNLGKISEILKNICREERVNTLSNSEVLNQPHKPALGGGARQVHHPVLRHSGLYPNG